MYCGFWNISLKSTGNAAETTAALIQAALNAIFIVTFASTLQTGKYQKPAALEGEQ